MRRKIPEVMDRKENCSIFDHLRNTSVRPGAYYNSKNMKGTYIEEIINKPENI